MEKEIKIYKINYIHETPQKYEKKLLLSLVLMEKLTLLVSSTGSSQLSELWLQKLFVFSLWNC